MPNDIARIVIAVKHGKLIKIKDALAIEGTINALKCSFDFRTQDWDDTIKYAAFLPYRATSSIKKEDIIYVDLDENNECDVPFEVLTQNNYFSVGVWGQNESFRIVSNWMCYKIDNGCYSDGSTAIDPSSTAYELILKMIKSKSDIGHNHNEIYYTKNEIQDIFNMTDDEISIFDAGSIAES